MKAYPLCRRFSFGSHVLAKCFAQLEPELRPVQLILCGLPTATVVGLRHYKTPEIQGDILLIHGEQDDITLLSDAIEWAKPQNIQSQFYRVLTTSLQAI